MQFYGEVMNQSKAISQRLQHSQESQPPSQLERLLYLAEVERQTGFKSSFLYQLMKEGAFPKPIKIGSASRWRQSEIQRWVRDQINASTSGKPAGGRA